jgi:hypothetical protein
MATSAPLVTLRAYESAYWNKRGVVDEAVSNALDQRAVTPTHPE